MRWLKSFLLFEKILKKSVTNVKKYDIYYVRLLTMIINGETKRWKRNNDGSFNITDGLLLKDDGAFIVVDLGEWLEEQDVYDIFVIEDDENNGYKKRFMKES